MVYMQSLLSIAPRNRYYTNTEPTEDKHLRLGITGIQYHRLETGTVYKNWNFLPHGIMELQERSCDMDEWMLVLSSGVLDLGFCQMAGQEFEL